MTRILRDHPDPSPAQFPIEQLGRVAFQGIEHQRRPSEPQGLGLGDFQSAIDDRLTGVTHIVRGIDLQDSAKRQRFLYDYFDWEYPEVVHWGHVQIDAYDVKMSTSTISELIDEGKLDGWDDPRAPTLKSLRRRGVRGEAVVEAIVGLGTSTSDVDLAMAETRMTLKYRVPDRQRLEWAQRIVEAMGDRPPQTTEEVYAREQIILHERQSTEIVVQALRITG